VGPEKSAYLDLLTRADTEVARTASLTSAFHHLVHAQIGGDEVRQEERTGSLPPRPAAATSSGASRTDSLPTSPPSWAG
jgi:hypothetical protein